MPPPRALLLQGLPRARRCPGGRCWCRPTMRRRRARWSSPRDGGDSPPSAGRCTYYAPGRAAALDAFHRRFLGPGDLAFDIGAHVGDRTASFRRLGARVVAVEPQPRLARLLRLLFGRDAGMARSPRWSAPNRARRCCG